MTSKQWEHSESSDASWWSIRDAAARFDVSHHTIRRWIREGKIQAKQRPGPHGIQYFIPTNQDHPQRQPPATSATQLFVDADHRPNLVGRDREINLLSQALTNSIAGDSSLVIVSGEAGIGKTSLVRVLQDFADEHGFLVVVGRCFELDNKPPFGPWIDMLHTYSLAHSTPASPAIDSTTLEQLGSSAELHRAIEQFFVELCNRQPIIIVLEDCHWADKSSVNLLRYLGRALLRRPALMVMTYRDDELLVDQPLHQVLPNLVRETASTRLRLSPLDRGEVEEMVRSRYPTEEADRQTLTEYLWKFSEGVPFYVDELATHLENVGLLVSDGEHWRLTASPQVEVPPLVRQVAINRFTSLPEQTREHLQVAAVIGVDADLNLLQQVTGASVDQLADSIEQALRVRLIDEAPEQQSIRFRHALIREALYTSVLVLRRREIHRQVAHAMTLMPDADPDVIAHHFSQAQDRREAEWLLNAGRRAAQTFAYQETIARFEKALEILERDAGSDASRARVLCELAIAYRYIDPHQALLLVGRGLDIAAELGDMALLSVLRRTRAHVRGFIGENGLPELRESVEMFENLSRSEQQRVEQSSLGHAVSGGALAQRVAYYAQYSDARRLAEQFLADVPYPRVKRDHYEIGLAHLALGLAHANLGDPNAAYASLARSRESFAEASNNYLYGMALTHEFNHVVHVYYPEHVEDRRRLIESVDEAFNRSVMAYLADQTNTARLFNALIVDGRLDEARKSALALVDNAYMRVECATTLAVVDFVQGRYDYAWEWVRRAVPEGPQAEPGTVYHHDILEVQQIATHLALQAGDLNLAQRWIETHECWHRASDSIVGKHTPEMLWASYHRTAGDLDKASEHALRALNAAQAPRQPFAMLHASRLVGELAQQVGRTDEATRYLSLALELARSFDTPYEIALSQAASAEALVAVGESSEAERLLQDARRLLLRLDARPALEQLDDLEARLSGTRSAPSIAGGLSARELEVLRLVATGLTDAEIAERLFISPRTVGGHLQSIYQKTGVSSRTAATATAFAYTHGLAGTED